MSNHPKTCAATRKDGQRCTAIASKGSFRWFHDPFVAEERDAARVRGGQNKATAVRVDKLLPETLRASITYTVRAMRDVAAGAMKPDQGAAIASLGTSLVRQYEAGVRLEQLASIEDLIVSRDTGDTDDSDESSTSRAPAAEAEEDNHGIA